MNKGQKHSEETRKKISENTKKAMKDLSPNKTAFRPGNIPWNAGLKGVMSVNSGSFQPLPIGTIRVRKNNGYEYHWIKTEKGWKRFIPESKPEKQIIINEKTIDQVKTISEKIKITDNIIIDFVGEQGTGKTLNIPEKKESEIKVSEIEIAAPKLTQAERKKIQRQIEREIKEQQEIERKKQAQREWFAQFGITNPVIRVELRRAEE